MSFYFSVLTLTNFIKHNLNLFTMKALQFLTGFSFKSKSRLIIVSVGMSLLTFSTSSGQKWLWGGAGQGSNKANDYATPVAADNQGNAYVTGQFAPNISFGSYNLTTGSDDVAYLVKYNSTGTVQWATNPTAITCIWSFGLSDATDPSGNIYVTGLFRYGTLQFGTTTLNSGLNGSANFLVKYDPNGNVLWAKQSTADSSSDPYSYSVACDNSGNAYITGLFYDSISFGAYKLIVTSGSPCAFIAKYDPNGNVLWAKQSTGPGDGQGHSVATSKGCEYITGYIDTYDTVYFGTYSIVASNATNNVFIVKYDTLGNVLWVQQSFGAINASSNKDEGLAVTTDNQGNAYIGGFYIDSITFGSKILTSPYGVGDSSAFLVKYNSLGNVVWAKNSSQGCWLGYSLASDNAGNIYYGGIGLMNTLKWGASVFTTTDSTLSGFASFIMKLDTAGNASCCSIHTNGAGWTGNATYSTGIASDPTGVYTYQAGTFDNDTLFCGPDILIPSNSAEATYVVRWNACNVGEGINEITMPNEVRVYPNPSKGQMNVVLGGDGYSLIKVYDVFGREAYSQLLDEKQSDLQLEVDVSNLSNGIYFMQIMNKKGNISKTIIIAN